MSRQTSLAFASNLRGAHHRIQVEAISEFAVLASLIATGHYYQGATDGKYQSRAANFPRGQTG